jgi:hypothetical protein
VFYDLIDSKHEAWAVEANRARYEQIRDRQNGHAASSSCSTVGNGNGSLPIVAISTVAGDGTA